MPFSEALKKRAREIDPDCWNSYTGMPKEIKRAIDFRRTKALRDAALQCLEADEPITERDEQYQTAIANRQAEKAAVMPTLEAVIDQANVLLDNQARLQAGDMTFLLGEKIYYNQKAGSQARSWFTKARVLNCVGNEIVVTTDDGRTWWINIVNYNIMREAEWLQKIKS